MSRNLSHIRQASALPPEPFMPSSMPLETLTPPSVAGGELVPPGLAALMVLAAPAAAPDVLFVPVVPGLAASLFAGSEFFFAPATDDPGACGAERSRDGRLAPGMFCDGMPMFVFPGCGTSKPGWLGPKFAGGVDGAGAFGEAGAFGLNCAAPGPAQTTAQSTEAETTNARCIASPLTETSVAPGVSRSAFTALASCGLRTQLRPFRTVGQP
jgi:hypothetical protein